MPDRRQTRFLYLQGMPANDDGGREKEKDGTSGRAMSRGEGTR